MRTRSPAVLVAAMLAAVGAVPAAGQEPGWTSLDPRIRPPGQSAAAMAYDEARHQMVLFPGYDAAGKQGGTWLREDGEWRRVPLDQEPEPRYAAGMAYDAARQVVVMFGGYGANPQGGPALALGDTWTWDGERWERLEPATVPPPRAYGHLAYDRTREELVLFGGIGIAEDGTPYTRLDDTWTWDGQDWSRRETPVAPSPRTGAGIAFDEARGETVLFGGAGEGSPNQCTANVLNVCVDLDGQGGDPGDLNDTWVWDGSSWARREPSVSPPVRGNMGMAYDPLRQRVVVFGGVSSQFMPHDTWVWDGTTWTDVTPASQPEARFSPAAAFDPEVGQVVLYGGHRITYLAADTWGWDGASWSSLEIPTPLPRIGGAMAYDPVRRVPMLFGGIADPTFGDTWTYDDGWRREDLTPAPPGRSYAAMATDTARNQVVLFGGLSESFNDLGDTWVWDGTAWHDRTPALPSLSPPARQSTAMAFDAARGEIVLFGGWHSDRDVLLGDTWTWNGSSWQLEVTLTAPPALRSHRMAYDAARQEVVLYGGLDDGNQIRGETWIWDGTAWAQETPAASPPVAAAQSMVYDAAAGKVLMFGGLGHQQTGVWAWDGSTWAEVPIPPGPSRRSYAMMANVPELGGSILFGGLSQGYRDDTWLLRLPA
ncbi:MAG TPA: kelch repeat-containing protein [Actinomycetota bacterium]